MDRQRQIQAVAEAVGEEISRYAYAAYLYENEKKEEIDAGRSEEGADSVLIEKATAIYAAAAVKGKIPEKWYGIWILWDTDNRRWKDTDRNAL